MVLFLRVPSTFSATLDPRTAYEDSGPKKGSTEDRRDRDHRNQEKKTWEKTDLLPDGPN